jgi:hypothetical protein
MVSFQASQSPFSRSRTSFSRSLRLALSRGSLTTSNRNSLPAMRRYFQLPSRSALRSGMIAPVELARTRCRAAGQDRSQVLAIAWISRVRRGAAGSQQRRHPVHRGHDLFGDRSRRDPTGPAQDRRNAKAAFKQFALHAGERPSIGEPLAAVVAGEDDAGSPLHGPCNPRCYERDGGPPHSFVNLLRP